MKATNRETLRTWWLDTTSAAFAVTLLHVLIDYHIGLYGETSEEMGVFQGLFAIALAGLYGWWALVFILASSGNRSAHRATLIVTVAWAALINGAIAVAAAPPPSAAFPFQDIAHFLGLGFGTAAAYFQVKLFAFRDGPTNRYLVPGSVAILVLYVVLGIQMFATNP